MSQPRADPGSQVPTIDRSSAQQIQTYLKSVVRSTWSYPEETVSVVPEAENRPIFEYQSRFYSPSDDSDIAKEKTGAAPRRSVRFAPAFFRSRRPSQSQDAKHHNEQPPSGQSMPPFQRRAQFRRRECATLQEMEWNQGLSTWVQRRNAWTGAVPISEAFPNTDSEDESDASEVMNESEIEDATTPTARTPSARNSDSADVGLTIVNHQPTQPLYPSAPTPLRRHIPRHEHLPFAVPVRDLIPATINQRAEFGPNMHRMLYRSLIQGNRSPVYPIPLKTVLSCLMAGWVDSGEWPGLENMVYKPRDTTQPRSILSLGRNSNRAGADSARPPDPPAASTRPQQNGAGLPESSRFLQIRTGGPAVSASAPVPHADELPTPTATEPEGRDGSVGSASTVWKRAKDNIKTAAVSTFSLRRPGRSLSINTPPIHDGDQQQQQQASQHGPTTGSAAHPSSSSSSKDHSSRRLGGSGKKTSHRHHHRHQASDPVNSSSSGGWKKMSVVVPGRASYAAPPHEPLSTTIPTPTAAIMPTFGRGPALPSPLPMAAIYPPAPVGGGGGAAADSDRTPTRTTAIKPRPLPLLQTKGMAATMPMSPLGHGSFARDHQDVANCHQSPCTPKAVSVAAVEAAKARKGSGVAAAAAAVATAGSQGSPHSAWDDSGCVS